MSNRTRTADAKEEATSALVPKLRFPEFHGKKAWEPTTLSAIADPVAARAVQGDEDNVLSLSAEHGIVLQSEFFGKRVAGKNSERYLKIAHNDFVYNDRTTKASAFGTIKRLSKHKGGIVSPIYKCFRFQSEENPVFWEWYFESGTHTQALAGLVNEGARAGRFNVSIAQFLSTIAWRPNEAEQQKIAECLSSVDELIAAQARKVEALKAHRKGLMQQLFPREGETQPRLRFPEFRKAKPWRERRIAEILTKVSIPVDVEEGRAYREIGVRSHGKGVFHKEPVDGKAIGEKRVFQVIPNALILNIVFAWEQSVATTSDEEVGMIASHRFPMFVSKAEDCDVRFVKYSLLTPRGKHLLGVASPGGAGRNRTLGQDEFEKMKLIVPSKDEQVRIADLVESADELTASQTSKLEALNAHKKGLMQQLFPCPEGVGT